MLSELILFLKKRGIFETNYVKGFALLIDVKIIKKIGMFDKNIFLYFEEIDLCKRLSENNYKIYVNSKAKIKLLKIKMLKFYLKKI